MNFKHIHIGQMIKNAVSERGLETTRICNFFHCREDEIRQMYDAPDISTEILLKWCKLLEYDFFRIYSQHLILYAPLSAEAKTQNKKTNLPRFRKNIYTKEIIDFVLERISSGEMSKNEVMERYKIPKTTLYKWIYKYKTTNI